MKKRSTMGRRAGVFTFGDAVLRGQKPLLQQPLEDGADRGPVDQLQHEQVRLRGGGHLFSIYFILMKSIIIIIVYLHSSRQWLWSGSCSVQADIHVSSAGVCGRSYYLPARWWAAWRWRWLEQTPASWCSSDGPRGGSTWTATPGPIYTNKKGKSQSLLFGSLFSGSKGKCKIPHVFLFFLFILHCVKLNHCLRNKSSMGSLVLNSFSGQLLYEFSGFKWNSTLCWLMW